MNKLPIDVQQIIISYLPIDDWETLSSCDVKIQRQTKKRKISSIKEKAYLYLTASDALAAVKLSGFKLEFVSDHLRTEDLCLQAVKENSNAISNIIDFN